MWDPSRSRWPTAARAPGWANAALRAVAPLTRAGAPEAAGKVLEEARQEAEEALEEAAEKPKSKPAEGEQQGQPARVQPAQAHGAYVPNEQGGRS